MYRFVISCLLVLATSTAFAQNTPKPDPTQNYVGYLNGQRAQCEQAVFNLNAELERTKAELAAMKQKYEGKKK